MSDGGLSGGVFVCTPLQKYTYVSRYLTIKTMYRDVDKLRNKTRVRRLQPAGHCWCNTRNQCHLFILWKCRGKQKKTCTKLICEHLDAEETDLPVFMNSLCEERWLRSRAPDCQLRGRWFHLPPFQNLGNFVHHTFACVFRKRLKSGGPFYLVSMPREVKGATQEVTCSGLTNSREGQLLH